MEDADYQQTAKVLWNILEDFQTIPDDNERLADSKLSHSEEFYYRNLYSLVVKLGIDSAKQPALATIHSLKDAVEKALPIYQKLYGQEAVTGSLSFLAMDESSIALLRQAGAEKTADFCAGAHQKRTDKIAKYQQEKPGQLEKVRALLRERAQKHSITP